MRIIFMGTPEFAVPTLESLISSRHQVIGVVTQPDKPRGRGKEMLYTPVKETAIKAGIPVYQPEKVREKAFVEMLAGLEPDVMVVVAFGQILSKKVLAIPRYGCVNVHGSLLPRYRGAAPIQWAVIEGEKESGVTAMFMNEGIDTGDMIKKVPVALDEKETGDSLHDKLKVLGGPLMLEVLDDLEEGRAVRIPQSEEGACYAKMLDKNMGRICFDMDAVKIERLIRGLNSWPSAYTSLNGKTLKIWEADVLLKEYNGRPGQVVEAARDRLVVKTGKGALALLCVQLEGKKRMEIADFLRGNPIEEGTILG